MEIISDIIASIDLKALLSAIGGALGAIIWSGVKKTDTTLDDDVVESLAEKIVEKAKNED